MTSKWPDSDHKRALLNQIPTEIEKLKQWFRQIDKEERNGKGKVGYIIHKIFYLTHYMIE